MQRQRLCMYTQCHSETKRRRAIRFSNTRRINATTNEGKGDQSITLHLTFPYHDPYLITATRTAKGPCRQLRATYLTYWKRRPINVKKDTFPRTSNMSTPYLSTGKEKKEAKASSIFNGQLYSDQAYTNSYTNIRCSRCTRDCQPCESLSKAREMPRDLSTTSQEYTTPLLMYFPGTYREGSNKNERCVTRVNGKLSSWRLMSTYLYQRILCP